MLTCLPRGCVVAARHLTRALAFMYILMGLLGLNGLAPCIVAPAAQDHVKNLFSQLSAIETLGQCEPRAMSWLLASGCWNVQRRTGLWFESIKVSWLGLKTRRQLLQVAHQAVLDLLLQLAESQEHTEAQLSDKRSSCLRLRLP